MYRHSSSELVEAAASRFEARSPMRWMTRSWPPTLSALATCVCAACRLGVRGQTVRTMSAAQPKPDTQTYSGAGKIPYSTVPGRPPLEIQGMTDLSRTNMWAHRSSGRFV